LGLAKDTYLAGDGLPGLLIHCCLKEKADKLLLIAVNIIGTYAEAVIRLGDLGIQGFRNSRIEEFKEIFSRVCYPVSKGCIRAKFKPFETKAFVNEKGGK
jgi:hypothetical protein